MPALALTLALLWFVLLFVFRSLWQWRQTGSTGIKTIHGRPGSLPWWTGVVAALGLLSAPLAPVAALRGWPGGAMLLELPLLHSLGAALTLVGTLGALAGQLAMGESWRVGVDPAEETQLVTHGLFRWTRNPIFSFIIVSAAGFLLLVPNTIAAAALGAVLLGIELQVRVVEEPYLLRTHGDRYRRYAERVGRFFPGIGRMQAQARRCCECLCCAPA